MRSCGGRARDLRPLPSPHTPHPTRKREKKGGADGPAFFIMAHMGLGEGAKGLRPLAPSPTVLT